MAILALLPLLYWFKKKQPREGFPYFEIVTVLATILVGVFVVGMDSSKGLKNHYSHHDLGKESLWNLKVREVLKPNSFSQRYVVQVISRDNEKCNGKMVLNLPIDSTGTKYQVDEELYVFSKPEDIKPPLNPHQFNYKDFLKKQGIFHQIRVNPESVLVHNHHTWTLLGKASRAREHIISKLKREHFGKEELAVIQALLLGQRDDISESTYNDYANAGAIHILAVSGLHVGILLLLLQFVLSPLERLPKGNTLKLVLIVLLLWGYAFVAGLSPSIIRAVTMFSFLAYALYLNRPTNSFNIVALSMFFILLVKPLMLFQVGFQMSYAAVLAIVWIYPKLQRFWLPENFIVRKTWQLLSVSVAAQLGVLPISLFYFHQFPALFFISNLLVIPFLGLILGFGVLTIVLSLFNYLPSFLVTGYNWTIKTMNSVIGWFAQQEGFIIKDIPFDAFQLILGYLTIIALVIFLSKPKWKTALVLTFGIVGLQVWGIWGQIQLTKRESLLLLHKSRNTVLLHQTGRHLDVHAKDTTNLNRIVRDYSIAERIHSASISELKNSYTIHGKSLYVIDSLSIYPENQKPDFLLLTQSPKINLERLLDSIQPKMVLVDGSNYKSYVFRWKKTCTQKEIPFHDTREKGFYVFSLEKD
ncbi:ComEC/Rec2 family competence protein [Flagellimonas nanhaiensis]|nr:ComEC/Rec2 family competence protein [Allomuricauda nanhaiensis]